MENFTVSSDLDTFMQSADKAAMRTNMDLGTAATKDVAATGDAAAGEVVKGDDTRLTDARTPVSHTHLLADVTDAGTIASQDANSVTITGGSVTGITDLAIADGGTGASTASAARTNLEVYSDAEVDAKVATKAVAGGVELDGANGFIQIANDSNSAAPFVQKDNVLTYTWNGNAKQETTRQIVYSKSYSDANEQGGVAIQLSENTTKLQVLLRQDSIFSGHYAIDWNNAIDGNWHSFALVLDYTGATPSITLYRDGVSLGSGNVSLSATGSFDDTLAVYAKIGKSASNNLYKAAINDFRIFNRALSAAEVADLYESGTVAVADRWGVPGGATGCIADLPLDEGIGYQFHDRSSNHFDALASTSGVTHLVPKTEGYIRDFNVDAYNGGSGNTELIDSSRAIMPQNYVMTTMLTRNNKDTTDPFGQAGGTFTVSRTDGGSNQRRAFEVTYTIESDGNRVISHSINETGVDVDYGSLNTQNNIAVTATSSNTTDLNLRIDYKIID